MKFLKFFFNINNLNNFNEFFFNIDCFKFFNKEGLNEFYNNFISEYFKFFEFCFLLKVIRGK